MYVILHVCQAEVLNFGFLFSTLFGYGFYFVILDRKSNLSLYKGSSGDWEMSRVTIWRPFSIPRSALNCFQRTRDSEPPAVLMTLHRCKGKKNC